MSTLAVSQGYGRLHLESPISGSNRAESAQDLARVLFSNHHLQRLFVRERELTDADVINMLEVLENSHPENPDASISSVNVLTLEVEGHDSATAQGIPRFVELLGSSLTSVTLHCEQRPIPVTALLALFQSCPSLHDAKLHAIDYSQQLPEFDARSIVARRLMKLHISISSQSANAINAIAVLIPLVGLNLEYLELASAPGPIPFASEFETIVKRCPSLFHLKLTNLQIMRLDPLIEAYESGRSRISSLYLLQTECDSDSLSRFAVYLGTSPATPESRKLGVFHVNMVSSEVEEASDLSALNSSSLTALAKMLETNRSITELLLTMQDAAFGWEDIPLRPFMRTFRAFDDQDVPVPGEPLQTRSLLAFLSVLHHKKCLQWEPEIVRQVCGFAARRARRSVRFDIISQSGM
ncbi:hypothetical protein PINS_up010337 [Pythium insidiosum]|nr:hypothetical protein PINS_up010337 [Pythium insidiosum]